MSNDEARAVLPVPEFTIDDVPEWVGQQRELYHKRRTEEIAQAETGARLQGSWIDYAATMLSTIGTFSPEFGSHHHACLIVAAMIKAERAALQSASPGAADAGGELLPIDAAVAYVEQYGPRCRDCADEAGVCPTTGFPCGADEKPIRHVIKALNYGMEHGFLRASIAPASEDGWRLLERYGTHDADCVVTRDAEQLCDCGFSAALSARTGKGDA